MSIRADIDKAFLELLDNSDESALPNVLNTWFEVFEALDWDDAAGDVVRTMKNYGVYIDGNQRCYIEEGND